MNPVRVGLGGGKVASRAEYKIPPMQPLCVFCRRHPVEPDWRPFCSKRCKLQDLARWADGTYAVPGEPLTDPDDGHPDESEKSDV